MGAEVVGCWPGATAATLKRPEGARPDRRGHVGGRRLALAFPQTYMNDSGQAVAPLVRRYGIEDPRRLVVVHDELDLPPGRAEGEGGRRPGRPQRPALDQPHLHTDDFLRVRIGVGKPPSKERGADHVLRRVPQARARAELDVTVQEAADAVELDPDRRRRAAMTRFNAAEPATDRRR